VVLDELGRRGLLSVLVEGGPQVLWSFASHADRVLAYVAPMLLGGTAAPGALAGSGFELGAALRLATLDATPLGDDILLAGDVHRHHH
jgi:diaminohydroxyphosphoribosylaminopyrimidine deaminase/5-amino-6-(5-phosphoribosylamino)uracil reductase